MVQCLAVCCNGESMKGKDTAAQQVCCRVLQGVGGCCRVLQGVAVGRA